MCTSSGDDERRTRTPVSTARRPRAAQTAPRSSRARPRAVPDDDTVVVDADDARDASETPRETTREANAYRRARCVDVAMAAFARAPSRSRARIGGNAREG